MYKYVVSFSGPSPLTSTISIADNNDSVFNATQALKPATLSGAPSVWVSTLPIPAISRPIIGVQAAVVFMYQEIVNGVSQIVDYPGLVDYATTGYITLSCAHASLAGRFCGWRPFSFDFIRV
jgi:hypothetical protein